MTNAISLQDTIRRKFEECEVNIRSIEFREYPQETIFIVFVDKAEMEAAISSSNVVDDMLAEKGYSSFVTVKEFKETHRTGGEVIDGVNDHRVNTLIDLLKSRSRTSELQPSLAFIKDVSRNISTIITPRQQLVFGRRGAGKTALMVEAKHQAESLGNFTLWFNMQTYRKNDSEEIYLLFLQKICELIQAHYQRQADPPHILSLTNKFYNNIMDLLSKSCDEKQFSRLIPQAQGIIRRFLDTESSQLFIFFDDFHYINKENQPYLLDVIHGSIRDTNAWMKVAGIRHLSKWFQSGTTTGLQTAHDADHIDLDVTLENPLEAKKFLEKVLTTYGEHVSINAITKIISHTALDRLVLASGAVPRDYLILTSSAIQQAKKREGSKLVGVQDVNSAAGNAAKVKITELEEDVASYHGETKSVLESFNVIKRFCLEEKGYTFFRIDFRDKEACSEEYSRIQDLLEQRLLHMVDSSLSDGHAAGRRHEVYMLDLSQFSGQRLKQKLSVLDFKSGYIVSKQTGTRAKTIVGDSSLKRLSILRKAPIFELNRLSAFSETV